MSVRIGAHPGSFGERLFKRDRVVVGVLVLVALALVFLIVRDVLFPGGPGSAAVRTAAVQRGSIRSQVSGTGTVVPAAQQNVNFGVAGTLAEIDVKVADHVTAGQLLARLDPTTYQIQLDQVAASVRQAEANLASTLNGNALQQAQHALEAARRSYDDTVRQVDLTDQQDAAQVASDQQQLQADQQDLAQKQADLETAQAQRDSAQATFDAREQAYQDCLAAHGGDASACSLEQQARDQARTALDAAQQKVQQDQQKLQQDTNKQAADQLAGERQVNQARAQVVQAQDQLASQTAQRPNTIAAQQAALAGAEAQLRTAQRNLDLTVMKAPFDGVVISINGQVGEAVSAGAGTTAQAPGSTAPAPSTGATSTQGGATSGTAASGFVVLGSVSGLAVVAPFAEADASRLRTDQEASVTFDAVSGLTLPARVLAVAGNATVISNVTNYYVTLVLERVDERLKAGMTANATVVVEQVGDALTVPNSAISRVGGSAFVTVVDQSGRQARRQVQTGVVGDTSTEILSGLREGDRVLLPQLRTPAQQGGGRPGGAGTNVQVR